MDGLSGRADASARKASGHPPAMRDGSSSSVSARDDDRRSARNVSTASTGEAPFVAVANM
jgi:hypothetical protein